MCVQQVDTYRVNDVVELTWGGRVKGGAETAGEDNAAQQGTGIAATIVRVCDPLASKPAKQLRVALWAAGAARVPIMSKVGTDSNDEPSVEFLAPGEIVSYTEALNSQGNRIMMSAGEAVKPDGIWYRLANRSPDQPGYILNDPRLAPHQSGLLPLQPFVLARMVDVELTGSMFSVNDRICVSIPGVQVELQSSVGVVRRVHADGSIDFTPDDAPSETWDGLRMNNVVRRVPMAWILGHGDGKKVEREKKGATASRRALLGSSLSSSTVNSSIDSGPGDGGDGAVATDDDPFQREPLATTRVQRSDSGHVTLHNLSKRAVDVCAAVELEIPLDWDALLPKPAQVLAVGKTDVELVEADKSVVLRGVVNQKRSFGAGWGGGDTFLAKGNVAVIPNFSVKKDNVKPTEIEVTELLEPLGKPIAQHVTQTYGITESRFMLQSAADDTLHFVGECLTSLKKSTNEDLAKNVLDAIYEKKVFILGEFFIDDDSDSDDEAAGPMELPERVKRAKMFANDLWHGAEEVPLVRDFGALFKMCLEPIEKLVENHGLNHIELDTLQLKLSWKYEDALKYKPDDNDDKEAEESADDDSGDDMDDSFRFMGGGGAFLDDSRGKRMTREELASEFPLVTLQLSVGSSSEKKALRTGNDKGSWKPKGFYRAVLEPNVAGSGGKKDHANISWEEAIEMPGAVVIESTPDDCKDPWRYASTSRGPPKNRQKYACNIDSYIPVQFDAETTKAVWCKFEKRSDIEYSWDYLEVFKTICGAGNRPLNDELCAKLMGRKLNQDQRPGSRTANFPGCREGIPNKKFPVHELELHWHTDDSVSYWGWVAVFWPETRNETPRVHPWALPAFKEAKLRAKGDESWDQFLEVRSSDCFSLSMH